MIVHNNNDHNRYHNDHNRYHAIMLDWGREWWARMTVATIDPKCAPRILSVRHWLA